MKRQLLPKKKKFEKCYLTSASLGKTNKYLKIKALFMQGNIFICFSLH